MSAVILIGDMRQRLRELADDSVDSCVCDPPYHLTSIVKRFGAANAAPVNNQSSKAGKRDAYANIARGFMGQTWDGGDVAFDPATWAEVLRVLKPGGHLIAFSGTRTYHRMTVAIEDAGFEVRDMIAWHYGSGFPKSLDVGKAIDKSAGAEREVVGENPFNALRGQGAKEWGTLNQPSQITAPATDAAREWEGWGTALKPATEPICLARKPISEASIAANVLKWGTGALNIDGCRIEHSEECKPMAPQPGGDKMFGQGGRKAETTDLKANGRWPANLCHDGSDEVVAGFPTESGGTRDNREGSKSRGIWSESTGTPAGPQYADSGSAARFFYCAKAEADERGSKCLICGLVAALPADECHCTDPETGKPKRLSHPTVKPGALMRWLVRLVTPKGGIVLDPFMGTGSTGAAAQADQFGFIGCELSGDYAAIAESRLKRDAGLFADVTVTPAPPANLAGQSDESAAA
jgi:DNA modification methylase